MTASLFNPANLLTFLRIALVPYFVWLMLVDRHLAAFAVFATAAISDFIDGQLARRFHWETTLGVILDPIGDKLLVLSAFILLAATRHIPAWMGVVAVAREVLVVSGIVLLALFAERTSIRRDIRSTWFGKLGTLLVMAFLTLSLARPAGLLPGSWNGLAHAGLGAALLVNFASGVDYAVRGFRFYARFHGAENP